MNVQIRKHTRYHGMAKRIAGYSAHLNDVQTEMLPTAQEAKDALAPLVEQACRFAFPQIVTLRGSVCFVSADRGNWYYTAPRDFSQEKDNDGYLACTIDGYATVEAATVAARFHLAQNLWDGIEDGEALAAFVGDKQEAATLLDWVAWQKRYKANRASGMTDVQAHTAACDRLPVPA